MRTIVFMRLIAFLFSLFFIMTAQAVKKIDLQSIGYGKLLHLGGSIELPKVHRLNKGAPSKIDVFEKTGKTWNLTETINLNDFFTLTEMVRFQKPVKLTSEKSDIKIGMTVYHCPADHKGICVIDDFEGLIHRDSHKVTSEVNLAIQGTDPTQQ